MKTDRIQYLLENYLSQNCSLDEKKELNMLINSLEDEDLKAEFRALWDNYTTEITLSDKDSQDILKNILSEKKNQHRTLRKKTTRSVYLRTISVAASLLLLISVGIYISKGITLNGSGPVVAKAVIVSPNQATSYIRNLTLPDGTTVILHTGSTLQFPKKFSGTTREVTLKGEAYFDVKHMASKPFIIHSGDVKTTVLGTAFNIKAWPGQKNVIVSVTRGKVRVENGAKVLAVLTVNQSVDYNLRNADAKQQTVNAEETVSNWTKQDMIFNRATFESIVQVLSQRYGKDITISNSELANTQITSSFSGTEPLENILETLCVINSNTQYLIDANEVTIINKN